MILLLSDHVLATKPNCLQRTEVPFFNYDKRYFNACMERYGDLTYDLVDRTYNIERDEDYVLYTPPSGEKKPWVYSKKILKQTDYTTAIKDIDEDEIKKREEKFRVFFYNCYERLGFKRDGGKTKHRFIRTNTFNNSSNSFTTCDYALCTATEDDKKILNIAPACRSVNPSFCTVLGNDFFSRAIDYNYHLKKIFSFKDEDEREIIFDILDINEQKKKIAKIDSKMKKNEKIISNTPKEIETLRKNFLKSTGGRGINELKSDEDKRKFTQFIEQHRNLNKQREHATKKNEEYKIRIDSLQKKIDSITSFLKLNPMFSAMQEVLDSEIIYNIEARKKNLSKNAQYFLDHPDLKFFKTAKSLKHFISQDIKGSYFDESSVLQKQQQNVESTVPLLEYFIKKQRTLKEPGFMERFSPSNRPVKKGLWFSGKKIGIAASEKTEDVIANFDYQDSVIDCLHYFPKHFESALEKRFENASKGVRTKDQ
jgi:hypothetical protein